MSHANAALTPRARLTVAQLVVDQSVPISEVAARFQCSWATVKRWAERYRAGQSMQDRSSRPASSPNRTPLATTKRVVSLRLLSEMKGHVDDQDHWTGTGQVDPPANTARDAVHFRRILAARQHMADADDELRDAVTTAREAGDSRTVIAAAPDTIRQAAQQRFGRT